MTSEDFGHAVSPGEAHPLGDSGTGASHGRADLGEGMLASEAQSEGLEALHFTLGAALFEAELHLGGEVWSG